MFFYEYGLLHFYPSGLKGFKKLVFHGKETLISSTKVRVFYGRQYGLTFDKMYLDLSTGGII